MREAKERTIFDNLHGYDFDEIKADYILCYDDENPSDETIWQYIYDIQHDDYEIEKERLDEIFNDWKGRFIAVGTCGRWDGTREGGFLFKDYDDLAKQLFKDCEYFHFWDENGHLFISGTHHDGTNCVEIKQLTQKGENYYDNWEYNWDDKRTDRYVFTKLFEDSHYSKLIHFAHRFYGVPKREYVSN